MVNNIIQFLINNHLIIIGCYTPIIIFYIIKMIIKAYKVYKHKKEYIDDDVEIWYDLNILKNTSTIDLTKFTMDDNKNDRIIINCGGICAKVFYSHNPEGRCIQLSKLFKYSTKMYSLIKKFYFDEKYDKYDKKEIAKIIKEVQNTSY